MKKTLLALAATASIAGPMLTIPDFADARTHHYGHGRAACARSTRIHARRGTIIGAVVGGVLGNTLGRGGGRTTATVVGAGVGAVAGHQIGRHNAHCR